MSAQRPSGAGAVMASRSEPPDSLDFFPTPPWGTRALEECVLAPMGHTLRGASIWEPACGGGHMSRVLEEYADFVDASDVHDYGIGGRVGSFVGQGPDVIERGRDKRPDWIITNPPFNLAEEFLERALREARGVALLVRTSWLEGGERYRNIFAPDRNPPAIIAQFAERLPMVKGRWDPGASTATSYAWLVWRNGAFGPGVRFLWIPPGQRQRLTRSHDLARYAQSEPA